jgi:phosphohistidine phosphatase SixA
MSSNRLVLPWRNLPRKLAGRRLSFGVLMLFALSLVSCSHPAVELESLKFVVVRHAEKQTRDNSGTAFDANDPELTTDGMARAQNLARELKQEVSVGSFAKAKPRVVAIYATPFKRTQATATPTAKAFSLSVHSYEANQDAAEFADLLRAQYQSGAVLIVGHSNTVPLIVAALCRCKAPVLNDSDYGDRFEIVLHAGAQPVLLQLQF